MAKAVEVVGPYHGATGYDRHTRELVRHFVRLGAEVQLHPLEGWSRPLPDAVRETWLDALHEPVGADVLLHFTMPTQARPRPGMRNINYTMFEADRIPRAWAERAADHDAIVVPTESSRRAWIASGVPASRLRVSPLGVDAEFFAAPCAPVALAAPDGRAVSAFRHRFLSVAALQPRKNHLGLLRCWIRATRRDDDAVLIVKSGPEELLQPPHVVGRGALRLPHGEPDPLPPRHLPQRVDPSDPDPEFGVWRLQRHRMPPLQRRDETAGMRMKPAAIAGRRMHGDEGR